MLIFGVTIVTLGSVASALREKFGLNNYQAGTLFSILPIGLLAGSLIFGPIADRYGYKNLISLAMLGVFLGFEGIAFTGDLNALRAFVFLFGFSGGIINGAANAVVVDVSDEHKGPNLQILGIFFGLGALGMPLAMGFLLRWFKPLQVLNTVAVISLMAAIFYRFIIFPPAKRQEGGISVEWNRLLRPVLLLVSFYLFFQSSLESIITNWTTTFIGSTGIMTESAALFALSIHMIGMVAMRILTGTVLRDLSQVRVLWICLALLVLGLLLMQFARTTPMMYAGLFLAGAGLSGGFPVMLGFVGHFYPQMSATAISFVFVIALTGNMLINYVTGIILQRMGPGYLPLISLVTAAIMVFIFLFIIQNLKTKKNRHVSETVA